MITYLLRNVTHLYVTYEYVCLHNYILVIAPNTFGASAWVSSYSMADLPRPSTFPGDLFMPPFRISTSCVYLHWESLGVSFCDIEMIMFGKV